MPTDELKTLKRVCSNLGGRLIYSEKGIEACKVGSTKIEIEGVIKDNGVPYFAFQFPHDLVNFP